MLPASGSTTSRREAHRDGVASMALPPSLGICTPTALASGVARTRPSRGSRPPGRPSLVRAQPKDRHGGRRRRKRRPGPVRREDECAFPILHVDHARGQRSNLGTAMTTPAFHDPRLTEQRNPRTQMIDVASSQEIVDLLHAEDARACAGARYTASAGEPGSRHVTTWSPWRRFSQGAGCSMWARGLRGALASWMRPSARRPLGPLPRRSWGSSPAVFRP